MNVTESSITWNCVNEFWLHKVIDYWFYKQETPKAEAVRTSQRDNAVNRAMEESQAKASSSVSHRGENGGCDNWSVMIQQIFGNWNEIEAFLTFP